MLSYLGDTIPVGQGSFLDGVRALLAGEADAMGCSGLVLHLDWFGILETDCGLLRAECYLDEWVWFKFGTKVA